MNSTADLLDTVAASLNRAVVAASTADDVTITVHSEGLAFERALAQRLLDDKHLATMAMRRSQTGLEELRADIKRLRSSLPSQGYISVGFLRSQITRLLENDALGHESHDPGESNGPTD